MNWRKLGVKSEFRPSNMERMLNCNLSLLLPKVERSKEQLNYLEERNQDHRRLFGGEFKESEEKCKAFHDKVVGACGVNLFREKTVTAQVRESLFQGTPDLYGFDKDKETLYILDYKTGFHPVNAYQNAQLLSYAALILRSHATWDVQQFVLAILNTQSDHLSFYYPMKETVLSHLSKIEKSFEFTYEKDTFFAIKGKWCQFCPSKTYCPLQRNVSEVKGYMDHDTDQLIYEKEKRKKELSQRLQELKSPKGNSEVFHYDLDVKKRFKYRKEECKDLKVSKKMTPAEAKKVLDPIHFDKYFKEEEVTSIKIGERKDTFKKFSSTGIPTA